jgi:serine/threonine protein kinase
MDRDDLSGSVIAGRYAIRREIGRGGSATLYIADDLRHNREVAVKVLRQELTDSIAEQRFTSEIATAARLSHPLIVPLHDSGEWEGRIYFVMQYVEGDSLRLRLDREQRLSIDDSIQIAREVAEALEFAHSRGIVHRDIKPANILIHAGHAAVADFGIALALNQAAEGRLTAGFALGTPAYMSPEQTYGDRDVDARSDVYSLGCVLYEMLGGAPPFRERAAQAMFARHRETVPASLRAERPEIPVALESVIMRALAKAPDERFASAKQFNDALIAAQAEPNRIEVVNQVTAESGRRNRSMTIGAFAVAILLVLAIGLYSQFAGRSRVPEGGSVALDRQSVMVAPFFVASENPELKSWKDALARLLASSLDGSGALQASSMSAGFKEQQAITDRDSAIALGRRSHAGFVVIGSVLEAGPSAVQAKLRLIDVSGGGEVGKIDFTAIEPGASTSQLLARMVDSLQDKLLASLGGVTNVAAVKRAAIGCPTSSESAKHRYLQAEQFFRQSAWDSARVAYMDVVAGDPKCGLAYHRLADVSSWSASTDDPNTRNYQLEAGKNNHGLAPRDSLLITADSLDAALRNLYEVDQAPASRYWVVARRLFESLTEASRRYPGDPEVWYALGDARYHWGMGPTHFRTNEVLAPFDSAIRLDSGFALSYLHAIEVSFALDSSERAKRYAAAYYKNRPPGVRIDWVRFATDLIDPKKAFSDSTRHSLETLSDDDLLGARLIVDRYPDANESALRISWQMATKGTGDSARIARCDGKHEPKRELSERLAYRGHFRESVCALGSGLSDGGSLTTELAMIGAVPPESADRVFDAWVRTGDKSSVYALPWWSSRRDTVRIKNAIRVADSLVRAPKNAAQREEAMYLRASARAHLTLAELDTAKALIEFRTLPDTLCIDCFLRDRWMSARLLAAKDSLDAADAILNEWPTEALVAREALMTLDRAHVAERLGRKGEAAGAYDSFIKTWQRGDDVVKAYLQRARSSFAALTRQ